MFPGDGKESCYERWKESVFQDSRGGIDTLLVITETSLEGFERNTVRDPGLPDRDVVLNRALDGRLIKHSPVACNASVQDAWRINSNSRWLNKNSSPISITTPFGLFLNTVTRRRFEKRGFVIGKGEEGLRREAGCRGMGEVWKDATEFRFVVN